MLGLSAVVVIPGRFHVDNVAHINAQIARLSGCVVIVTSDEESLFPIEQLDHDNMRLWVMTPRPERDYPDGTRFIGEGYTPGTPEIAASLDLTNKPLDWFFAGQITHVRREQLAGVLKVMPGGMFLPTAGFTQGLDHEAYLRTLASCKVAPCPSGAATQDSFRAFEALELGCVPVLDGLRPDGGGRGYWEMLFGDDHPLYVVDDWADFPGVAASILAHWPVESVEVSDWWAGYKADHHRWLAVDLAAVSGP